jgi:predicted dehydrogenase
MYLCAGDKAIGARNFHSVAGSKQFRRELAAEAVRQNLSPRNGLEAAVFSYKPPENPLAVGLLGAGQQGRRLLRAASPKYLALKSIADVRPSSLKQAAEFVKDAHTYDSYEKLLAAAKEDGLEAVIIALPSHLHAAAALAALDKGLHVFIEPPMALTVADAKKIVASSEEKKLCAAVGQQRRYNLIYENALEMVRKDLLHQPHYLRAQWHLAGPEKAAGESSGGTAKANGDKIDWWPDVPKEEREMDFAGYQNPDELVRWRLYEKYSGGLLAELGSLLFDSAAMLVAAAPNHDPKRPYPLSVAGSGSQVLHDPQGDIDDHVHCIFEYAIQGYVDAAEVPPKARKKIALQFDLQLGSDFDTYGETLLGRRGSLVVEGERRGMIYYMADSNKLLRVTQRKDDKGAPTGPPMLDVPKDGKADEESEVFGELLLRGADAGFAAELEHWACCCRGAADGKSESKPRCDARTGLYTTVLTVAATKAVKLGTRVDFKDEWFDPKSEETPDGLE